MTAVSLEPALSLEGIILSPIALDSPRCMGAQSVLVWYLRLLYGVS